jgi:hypothetical protein
VVIKRGGCIEITPQTQDRSDSLWFSDRAVLRHFFKKFVHVAGLVKIQGVPLLCPTKTASPPREVSRFLLAEKSDNFLDLGDVLHNEALLMKSSAAQQEAGKSYRPQICV